MLSRLLCFPRASRCLRRLWWPAPRRSRREDEIITALGLQRNSSGIPGILRVTGTHKVPPTQECQVFFLGTAGSWMWRRGRRVGRGLARSRRWIRCVWTWLDESSGVFHLGVFALMEQWTHHAGLMVQVFSLLPVLQVVNNTLDLRLLNNEKNVCFSARDSWSIL